MLQLKILHAAAKTQHSQMNEFLKTTFFLKKKGEWKYKVLSNSVTHNKTCQSLPRTLHFRA